MFYLWLMHSKVQSQANFEVTRIYTKLEASGHMTLFNKNKNVIGNFPSHFLDYYLPL